jgi:hypothetical protein
MKERRVQERKAAIQAGTIPDPDKPRRLEDAITFVGTCMDMCPEFERYEREFQLNIEKFERVKRQLALIPYGFGSVLSGFVLIFTSIICHGIPFAGSRNRDRRPPKGR